MLATTTIGAALRALGATQATTAFVMGGVGPGSSLCAAVLIYIVYAIAVRLLYYGIGPLMQATVERLAPASGTARTPHELRREHRAQSEAAFPMYTCVGFLSEWLQLRGLSKTCFSIKECGGLGSALLSTAIWFVIFEFGVFLVHWGLLHRWEWGKKAFLHSKHHAAKSSSEMTVWTGFAFEAIDGTLQGLPLPLSQLLVPVPYPAVLAVAAVLGIWTMYIHIGEPHLPWPLMGADYHFIHHKYNKYNYGMFTILCDTAFGTIKHPTEESMRDPGGVNAVSKKSK